MPYSEFVESLKRLYLNNKIKKEYIIERKSLSEEEKKYILSTEPPIDYEVAYKELTDGSNISPEAQRKSIQALFASADDTSIVNAEPFVDEWVAGTMEQPIEYKIGDVRKEQGQVYECKQAHTHHGEEDWNPSTFKAGWIVKHTKDTSNPKPYIQPQGAHDAYMKDEVALATDGFVYKSLIDNNVWEPTSYPQGWQKVE